MNDIERLSALIKADAESRREPTDELPITLSNLMTWLAPIAKGALAQEDADVRQVGAVLSTVVMCIDADDKALIAALVNTAKVIGEYQLLEGE